MKIYTKKGDSGTTSLFGGKRVEKSSERIEAYGSVDELNSLIGVIVCEIADKDILKSFSRIQNELFVLGGDLATPLEVKVKIPHITKTFITRLEKEIDKFDKSLPELKNFILPGGGKIGSKIHLARTLARRAERRIVDLSSTEKINKLNLIYINRLSDWLFVAARYVNKIDGVGEKIWKGRK